jgi:hypothetical protein
MHNEAGAEEMNMREKVNCNFFDSVDMQWGKGETARRSITLALPEQVARRVERVG